MSVSVNGRACVVSYDTSCIIGRIAACGLDALALSTGDRNVCVSVDNAVSVIFSWENCRSDAYSTDDSTTSAERLLQKSAYALLSATSSTFHLTVAWQNLYVAYTCAANTCTSCYQLYMLSHNIGVLPQTHTPPAESPTTRTGDCHIVALQTLLSSMTEKIRFSPEPCS